MATEEKTEQATPRRRQKAREEGQVAQSKDLTGAIALAAAIAVYKLAGSGIGRSVATAAECHFADAGSFAFTASALSQRCFTWMAVVAGAVLPVALAALAAGMTANLIQTGIVFATKRINPTADKLNPISGLKRIFSINGLVEAAKGLLKVTIVAFITWRTLSAHQTELLALQRMALSQALGIVSAVVFQFAIRYCLALILIGGADYAYQRWQHEKQLRMSHHEVKREHREAEGDPQIRAQRRRHARALLQQGITPQMPQADVVVTNPTHVAVALMYKDGQMPAPLVVARGRGGIAARIRHLARTYGIPIVEEPATARALYEASRLGESVPPLLYQAVAEILAGVYRAAAERRARRLARLSQRARPDQ